MRLRIVTKEQLVTGYVRLVGSEVRENANGHAVLMPKIVRSDYQVIERLPDGTVLVAEPT